MHASLGQWSIHGARVGGARNITWAPRRDRISVIISASNGIESHKACSWYMQLSMNLLRHIYQVHASIAFNAMLAPHPRRRLYVVPGHNLHMLTHIGITDALKLNGPD